MPSLVWQLGLLVGFGLVLSSSADLVVRATATIARSLGLTSFIIGFLLLGIATSTPEFFVALQSAADGVPQLSLGNLVGASILLLSFVIGLAAVISGQLKLNHQMKLTDVMAICSVIASPIFVVWDGNLTRVDGLFLIGFYVLHVLLLNHDQGIAVAIERRIKRVRHIGYHLGELVLGLGGITFASKVIVENAELVTQTMKIPILVFGLFFLSVGTNLPEISLAVGSLIRRQKDIAFGDLLGSSAVNTFILGLLGVIQPFSVIDSGRLHLALGLLAGVALYFVWAVSSGKTISRKEGIGLLFFYGAFVAYELFGL